MEQRRGQAQLFHQVQQQQPALAAAPQACHTLTHEALPTSALRCARRSESSPPRPPVRMAGGQSIAGHARVARPLSWVHMQPLPQLLLCKGQGRVEVREHAFLQLLIYLLR